MSRDPVEGTVCTTIQGPESWDRASYIRYTLDADRAADGSEGVLLRIADRGFTDVLNGEQPTVGAVFLKLPEAFEDLFDEDDIEYVKSEFASDGVAFIAMWGLPADVPLIDPTSIKVKSLEEDSDP